MSGPGKYLAVAGTAWRQALSERSALLGRLLLYAVLLAILSRLWLVVAEKGALSQFGHVELVWYLALTEWVAIGVPPVHLDIEADVRSGEVAYRLPRPMSYVGAQLAQSAGDTGLRMLSLFFVGIALAWLLSGGVPQDLRGLGLAVPLVLGSAALALQLHTAIGLSAFWLQDCSPFYWIYQKSLFIFGGLLLPLEFYPEWLRGFASATPFAAMLHGPAHMAFGFDPAAALEVGAKLLVWNLLAAATLWWVFRRALRVLDVNGG